jgi:hypothetical protein
MFLRVASIFFGLMLCLQVHAQDTTHVKREKTFWSYFGVTPLDDTVVVHKNGLFVTPLIYYSPDTRWGFGGAGAYVFHMKDKLDTNDYTRASYIRFLADYTMNRQTDVWMDWSVFTRKERYYYKGEFRFRNFPDKFYGIGNDTQFSDEEFYSYNLFSFKFLAMRKVYEKFFVGMDYHFSNEFGFKYTQGGQLETGTITGYRGGIGSALGFVSVFDTRDNVINAFSGEYAEFSSYFYSRALGGTFSFSVLEGEFRKFWQLKPKHILAFQTKARLTYGDVPFLDMSMVGNEDMLRGYPKNRFRDNHFMGTQVEYRFPLFWRFGMTTFAGFGDVFSRPQDLSWRTMKYTVGAGLRFMVNSAERLNIRVDYGYGSEGGYFYVSVAESF